MRVNPESTIDVALTFVQLHRKVTYSADKAITARPTDWSSAGRTGLTALAIGLALAVVSVAASGQSPVATSTSDFSAVFGKSLPVLLPLLSGAALFGLVTKGKPVAWGWARAAAISPILLSFVVGRYEPAPILLGVVVPILAAFTVGASLRTQRQDA